MFAQLPFVFQSRTVRGVVARARLSRLWEPPSAAPEVEPDPAPVPGPQRTRLTRVAVALGALSSVVAVAVLLLVGAQEPVPAPPLPLAVHDTATTTAERTASRAPAKLVVSVVGKVAKPGLVTIDKGARVADALKAAGGPVRGANLATVNLARKLSDGEQIYVDVPIPAGMTDAAAAGSSDASEPRVDLNAATDSELQELPGVGEVTAQRILEWRAENGGFTDVEQLREVSGIGEQRLADLRERVTIAAAG
ncbi:MAG: ComEA family DNA-binding protein [Actinophytocola sp.]|nr:ComEA family DNA-binding protein [Actinophytocola sp.]